MQELLKKLEEMIGLAKLKADDFESKSQAAEVERTELSRLTTKAKETLAGVEAREKIISAREKKCAAVEDLLAREAKLASDTEAFRGAEARWKDQKAADEKKIASDRDEVAVKRQNLEKREQALSKDKEEYRDKIKKEVFRGALEAAK